MFFTRMRQSLVSVVVVAATVAGTTALLGTPAGAVTAPDGGTSSAYGAEVSLLGGDVIAPMPMATLHDDGSADIAQTLPLAVNGLVTANTLNAQATSTDFGQPNEQINAQAGVEGLTGLNGISLLNTLLNVTAVNTQCNSNATGSTAATQIAGLSIGGAAPVDLPSVIPPNTGLTAAQLGPLAGLVTITLNLQTGSDRPVSLTGTNISVIGIQITLLSVLSKGLVINLAESSCAASGPDIEAVPTVSSVTPNVGPALGGTAVTIQGGGFTPTSGVLFGGIAASDVAYHAAAGTTPAYMTADSPKAAIQNANSTVPVQVTDKYGAGPLTASAANDFTYDVTPTLTAILPTSGPTLGGQPVTLTGANFGPDSTVYFGSGANQVAAAAATTVVGANGVAITAVTPPHVAGPVNVEVADAGGTSTLTNGYTYILAPIDVTSVVPDVGPTAGGTAVVITGQGFTGTTGATGVTFGGVNATNYVVKSDTTIDATSPAGAAGTVNVIVTNTSLNENPASGDSSFAVVGDQFTYESAPTIAVNGIVPNEGPVAGGTPVVITGTNFGPDSTVLFNTTAATQIMVVSPTEITADSPPSPLVANAGAGAVAVTVVDAGGTSGPEAFTYVAPPTISANGINPDVGPTAGGTSVTITGTNFAAPATVTFAGNDGTSVNVVSATEITVTTPPGVVGPAAVVVSDPFGTTANANNETFTYVAPPFVPEGGLNPAYGPVAGGTVITITGTSLAGVSSVVFNPTSCAVTGAVGGTDGTALTDNANGTVTVTSPASTLPGTGAGSVAVCLTGPGGTAPALQPFTYESVPVVTSFTPTSGPVAGGTIVTITGSGFGQGDPNTLVTFGGTEASEVAVESPTEIEAVTPVSPLPGSGAGAVPVVITDAGGTTIAGQKFTYVVLPVISGISPTSGPTQGGETVTIKGTDLCGATSVLFGTNSAIINSVSSDCTTLSVTEPAGTGTVPVTVTTPGGTATSPENFTYISPGYWEAASDGGVFAFGGAKFFGSVPGVLRPGQVLNSPIVAMADTPDHGGYWLFAADGGVFAFGDAPFYGSVPGVLQPGQKLNGPIVTAEATPDGGGYREFAADGGVFDFGDAVFEGSLPGEKIFPTSPIAGATAYPFGQGSNPNNAGYWLVGADGSIFTFGNAPSNLGEATGQIFGKVVALATTPTGEGYYMFLQSGPVAAFGDAVKGLGGATNSDAPVVFGQSTSTGKGYWEFAADGGVFSFGDAPYEGSLGGIHLNAPITAGIAFGSD
jgi:hypothetical protein